MDFSEFIQNSYILLHKRTHSQFVQIDMVLTLNFRQGLPRNVLIKAWKIIPRVGANSGMIFQAYIKICPGKSLTEIKGKDHIYLDKFAMGSVYVMKSTMSV